jgi:glycosyltransferase involved in cell wall biosynthesis
MLKVAFITNSLTGGGAERSVNLVVNELSRRKLDVLLIPINYSSRDLIVPNCTIIPLNREWNSGFLKTLNHLIHFNYVLLKLKPDFIILNCELPELFGALTIRKTKIIVVEHSKIAWRDRKLLGLIIRLILLIKSAKWVTVSSELRIKVAGKVFQSHIIENPVVKLQKLRKNNYGDTKLKRLIYIGRLSPEKNFNIVLDIAKEALLELIVIGDGPLIENLKIQSKKNKIKSRFIGYKTNPWNFIKVGDLLIIPSKSEGDGLVLLEGMQLGLPILLSDISDFRRFNLNSRNYCKTQSDFLLKIKNNKHNLNKLVIKESISRKILQKREISLIADRWENYLDNVIDND